MIGATCPARIRNPSPGAAKSARALVVVSILLVPSLAGIRQAGALLDPFAMSPTAGPPGTVVHLSGSGCAPGIAVSPASDYVKITSSALSPSTNIPVAANGSWSGSVTVPATAPALPGLVVATCFTDGFLSLTATYAPKTFTVTSAPPPVGVPTPTTGPSTPTTAPATPATVPGPTPTTVSTDTPPSPSTGGSTPGDNRGGRPGPGPTTVSPGPAGTGGAPGSSGSGASPGGTAGHAPKNSGSPGAIAASRPNLAETASAAGLADPSLARASRNDGSNSVWLLWLVLLVLVAAASAFLWWWHRRLPGDSEPTHEAP
ncbi:MAG: hypothetical protein JWM72_1696 [Actinomycetia bacterium]|nr:hypothetical protein [Actinomycetes bacterium]